MRYFARAIRQIGVILVTASYEFSYCMQIERINTLIFSSLNRLARIDYAEEIKEVLIWLVLID